MLHRPPKTTLEQWAVLRMVIEAGSFADAAAMMARSQSSVSYAIARLQESLGVSLLRMEGRRAVLTEQGRVLLAEVAPLIDAVTRLEGRVGQGEDEARAHLRIRVDSLFPRPRLMAALAALAARHPGTAVDIEETVRQPPPDPALVAHDLAVALPDPRRMDGQRIHEAHFAAVAHPGHPLATAKLPASRATLARHRRVVVRERAEEDRAALRPDGQVWLVNSVENALALVRAGLCHGWLPQEAIAGDLAAGRLVAIPASFETTRTVSLDLTFADADGAGREARFLAEALLGRAPD